MESETSEQGRFTRNVINQYLHCGCHPDGSTKSARHLECERNQCTSWNRAACLAIGYTLL